MAESRSARPDQAWESLRDYQQDAVSAAESFLEVKGEGAFIVTMPTGSGKSGVISFLAQTSVARADVLLLCPWDALADQLRRDVSFRFWEHAQVDSSNMTPARRLMPSTTTETLEKQNTPGIWVMTLAGLQQLRQHNSEAWLALKERVGLVIVDEGHYEPAPTWARSVRELDAPSLIFTATPFRNDRKYFAVRRGDSFHYRVRDALEQRIVRTPQFEKVSTDSVDSFAADLEQFAAGRLSQDDRIVVRCKDVDQIRSMVHALRTRNFDAIGIHDRFTKDDMVSGLHKSVPANHQARVWVHQKKLVEGIDDGAFRAIAIYSGFGHDRALVQQIGRVLRDPSREPDAFVLGSDATRMERSWRAFVEFDETHEASETPAKALVEASRRFAGYVGGTFRLAFDPNALDDGELRLPVAATAFYAPQGMENPFDKVVEHVTRVLDDDDAELVGPEVSEGSAVDSGEINWYLQLHVLPVQSPLLAESAFVDSALGFTFVAGVGNRIYVQSSARLDLLELGLRLVPTQTLQRAFDGAVNRFSTVSLRNTDISDVAERSRAQSAASLADLAPDLGDYFRAPSTITGAAITSGRDGEVSQGSRYVGFGNARIREHGRLGIADYIKWVEVVDEQLQGAVASAAIFERFAEPAACASPTIVNALIHVDALAGFETETGEELVFADESVEVDEKGRFELRVEGVADPFKATLKWDVTRFVFRSSTLDEKYSRSTPPLQSVSIAITDRQAFSLIVHDQPTPDVLLQYVNRGFVRPRSGLALDAGANGIDLDLLVTAEPSFSTVQSEKGKKLEVVTTDWPPTSLFKYICDGVAAGSLFGSVVSTDAILVCDDDSHESADFYLLDQSQQRLTAIHAKSKDVAAPGTGASGLHDVVAQAQKNLKFIRPGGEGFPREKLAIRWASNWETTSAPRMRSAHDAADAAEAIWNALRDPTVEREVVIAASGILSRSAFKAAARAGDPRSLQALYLLQAGWASVGAIGARLKVVINP